MPAFWAKLRRVLSGKRRFEDDLRDEMRAHLLFEIEDSLARGVPLETARADAQRRFGNATTIAERSRGTWDFHWLADLVRDLRYSARSMARRPAFAAVALISLAVALGANTAVFSFANAILLKTLPVAGADRLISLRQKNEQFHMENCCFGYPFFQALRKQPGAFEDILATSPLDITLTDREESERLPAELVSGNYFRMLGVHPAAGRLLDETDDAVEGASPVCVISYKLWQERYAGDPSIVGRQVLLNGHSFRIVGVSQYGFGGASLRRPTDIQAPTSMTETFFDQKRDGFGFLSLVPRLKPSVSRAQSASWLNSVGHALQDATGPRMGKHDDFLLFDGSQGIDSRREEMGKPVLVLLLLVGVLLLVACANLSALLLVRSVERTREAGVRAAIGASRSTLFRQFLAEALLLAAAGGALGWALALGLVRVLLGLLPPDKSLAQIIHPDATVFAFTAALTLLAALLFGLFPAWRASRADPLPAIRGAVLAASGRRQRLASSAVIAAQIALSLALVFCAGLFSRTLHNLRAIDLGFQAENVVVLPIDLENTAYAQEASPFFTELLRRARALPETRAASLTGLTVVSGAMSSFVLAVPGYVPPNGMRPTSYVTRVTSGYAAALAGIGLYGVLSFAVTRRTKEIGIRLSVGARRATIVALFLREGAWMAAAGVALGIPLMLLCGKLADSLLYGLQGEDTLTAAVATAALVILSLLVGFVPAARAAGVDPVRALRHD